MEHKTVRLKALGIALSGTMTIITLLCVLAGMLLPSFQATHNWLSLVASGEAGSFRNLLEAVFNGLVVSWIAAAVFAKLYNQFEGV